MRKTRNEVYTRIARNARKWRRENEIKLKEMAERVGCSPSAIYNFEMGCNNNASILLAYIEMGFTVYPEDISYDD